ncbi:MAG: NUDIX hydrolase [Candidatus Merdivicinus sp.]|jgi:8-oxo-dGTP pyrophosphatase MutT (NUDIX family)
MEMLTELDEELRPLRAVPREIAHRDGLLHAVVHCWVVSRNGGEVRVWFQQRAHTKKDFPDYYDIAVGGHIDVGEDRDAAALREMREEIGLDVQRLQLRYLGYTREEIRLGGFFDREIGHVYLYEDPHPAFRPGEEVSRMIWLPLEELVRKEVEGTGAVTAYDAKGGAFLVRREEWCVHPGEFEMIVLPALRAEDGRESL